MMTDKKLSILHTESSTGWGGQEIRILTEAAGMIARGHRVVLITPPEAEIAPVAIKRGIPTVTLPVAWKNREGFCAMRAYLKAHHHEFDVINTHSSTDSWLVATACTTLRKTPPLVRTRHVSTTIRNKFTTQWLYQKATRHIVTTGEALRQQLHHDNRFALNSMTSIRTGIDLDYYRPLDQHAMRAKLGLQDRPTIGILATLRDWKGHDQLLESWAVLSLEFPEWQVLFIGDGPRRGHLERRVDELDLRDSVLLVGNQDNVPEWLACIDLFVLPSYGEEGVPQGLMQAMACGKPAISTPIGAISEALQDGQTGLMTPPKDVPRLTETLRRLLWDRFLREQFAQASLHYARSNFGIEIMLDRMEQVFHNVLIGEGRC